MSLLYLQFSWLFRLTRSWCCMRLFILSPGSLASDDNIPSRSLYFSSFSLFADSIKLRTIRDSWRGVLAIWILLPLFYSTRVNLIFILLLHLFFRLLLFNFCFLDIFLRSIANIPVTLIIITGEIHGVCWLGLFPWLDLIV